MSTLESTISMLETLPEDDLVAVNHLVKHLMFRSGNVPFHAMNKEQMLEELETARRHVSEGKVKEGHQVAAEMRDKYGL